MRYAPLHIGLFIFAGLLARLESGSAELDRPSAPQKDVDEAAGRWHSVKLAPRPDHPKIRTRDKWNPVWWYKNSDDPQPPANYKPNDKRRDLKWQLRNPFHNFTFYVIGVADKKTVRSGRYPKEAFNPRGGCNVAVTKHKLLRLPFVSYCRGKKGFHFYCGWRPRGNFGFKCNFE